MSKIQELSAIKKKIFLEIAEAARNSDIAAIESWKEALEECEKLLRNTAAIEGQIDKFIASEPVRFTV